jgi:tripartite-type tricarboxylate transporter receptor subunit TctC
MRVLAALIVTIGTMAGLSAAHAQGWPSRPITMIVPFPPGPALDQVASRRR